VYCDRDKSDMISFPFHRINEKCGKQKKKPVKDKQNRNDKKKNNIVNSSNI